MNKQTSFAVGALLLSGIGVGAAVTKRSRSLSSVDRPDAGMNKPAATKGRAQNGTELVAIFVVSSACGASQTAALPALLDSLKGKLRARAAAEGKRFAIVGVSLDERPDDGIAFLRRFGTFDEVMTGGNWVNAGALTYLVRTHPGQLAIPQIILVERDIRVLGPTIKVSDDRLLARFVGGREIARFAEAAATAALR